ncbi:MAG: ATP-binding cassette domain-containing protein [Candidatus Cloacimonetes bacterium]|nr:ATP-binding cassette domain-containing protein [Candidatus Cloacimonadota bacterium]
MPNKLELNFSGKISKEKVRESIDMVASLYVTLLRGGSEINPQEIGALYSILHHLFSKENISWESQLRNIVSENIELEEILKYLNRNLITLDKIRILLGLIILADSDENFTASEVTKILDVAKKLNVETHSFMEIIQAIDEGVSSTVAVSGFRFFAHTHNSIFSDYLILGKNPSCDILFKGKDLSDYEILIFELERFLFLGTNQSTTASIDGEKVKPNHLYLFHESSELSISDISFNFEVLDKLYRNKEIFDIIEFSKDTYDFRITNNNNKFSIDVGRGTIYLNERKIPLSRQIPLSFDDKIRIEGYDTFSLPIVIRERARIGTEIILPKQLFIVFENDYFTLSRVETPNAIIFIESIEKSFFIYPPKKGWELFINNKKITGRTPLEIISDTITINQYNFKINSYYELVEIPFEAEDIKIEGLLHYFADGKTAIDDFSFSLRKSEFMAVMGQSGCGKSTLLKALSGEIIPTYGTVFIGDKNLYQNLGYLSKYIGYVPQDDILFSHLTVYENLFFRARLQMPKLSVNHLNQKVRNILSLMKLSHRSNSLVGNLKNNLLSGGERKRLNISLELLLEPAFLICDEPTSGLSATDSEQIIDILKNLTRQGKIVIITIHQPNSTLFEKFDKIMLMDRGGKLVYFGDSDKSFNYFDNELEALIFNKDKILRKQHLTMPEFLSEVIEYPEYKETGEIIYEQVDRSLIPKRKFPPEYWHDKFKKKTLFEIIQTSKQKIQQNIQKKPIQRKNLDFSSKLIQLRSLTKRNFLLKLRNLPNLLITFAEAPLLAFIIAFILRLAPETGNYSYYKNSNMSVFYFISIIVFIFFGLSASIEEILTERKNILRELRINLRTSYFILSKFSVLSLFAFVQVISYTLITHLILDMKGFPFISIVYYFLSSMIGYSLGLFISTVIHDSKSIVNIIPIILIPQIIFGGAVIQYEKMNRDLKLYQKSPIPEIVQMIPSRWLFEGIFTGQAKLNSYVYKLDSLERKRIRLKSMQSQRLINEEEYWQEIYEIYNKKKNAAIRYNPEVFTNESIITAVNMMDGKFLNSGKNVFLSSYKQVGNYRLPTYYFNISILIIYVLLLNLAAIIKLRFFYKE